jgi:hypothetical protein
MRSILWLLVILAGVTSFEPAFGFGRNKPGPELDPSLSYNTQLLLLNDLDVIYKIPEQPGAGPLHEDIFGSINGQNYEEFFNSHVNAIAKATCNDNPRAIACAYGFAGFFKMMWLTSRYSAGLFPQAERISMLFHEARHTEFFSGNWRHVACPATRWDAKGRMYGSTQLENRRGCDDTAQGSYGLQVILMANLAARCNTCSAKFKLDAQMAAQEYRQRIIDLEAREELDLELEALAVKSE